MATASELAILEPDDIRAAMLKVRALAGEQLPDDTDAAFARAVGITTQEVSDVRNGRRGTAKLLLSWLSEWCDYADRQGLERIRIVWDGGASPTFERVAWMSAPLIVASARSTVSNEPPLDPARDEVMRGAAAVLAEALGESPPAAEDSRRNIYDLPRLASKAREMIATIARGDARIAELEGEIARLRGAIATGDKVPEEEGK